MPAAAAFQLPMISEHIETFCTSYILIAFALLAKLLFSMNGSMNGTARQEVSSYTVPLQIGGLYVYSDTVFGRVEPIDKPENLAEL